MSKWRAEGQNGSGAFGAPSPIRAGTRQGVSVALIDGPLGGGQDSGADRITAAMAE